MGKTIILAVFAIFLVSSLQGATFFKWVDEKGVTNFTDNLDNVPPAYRDRVLKERVEDAEKPDTLSTVQQPVPQSVERNTDVYGRGESWWREKVRPLKERLREATEKYEHARQKFLRKAEEVSQTSFAGRSRFQTRQDAAELNRLREEEKRFEAQVAEANEMFRRLAKEAEEAKANFEWLN